MNQIFSILMPSHFEMHGWNAITIRNLTKSTLYFGTERCTMVELFYSGCS